MMKAPFSSSPITAVFLFCSISSLTGFQLQHATTSFSNPRRGSSFTPQLNSRHGTGSIYARPNGPSNSRRHSISMHMGHSHSHHHHHEPKPETKIQPMVKPTTLRGKIIHQLARRGKTISILFAAAATILPVLLFRQRRLNRMDVALFAIISTAISLVDKVRSQTKSIIEKAKGIRDGLIKHAPPPMSASKYLFQNDNAADRVTLVGVIVNLVLSVGKGFIGITCNSSALVADAGHSLSDLFSDFITLWAVQIARLPPDDDVSL